MKANLVFRSWYYLRMGWSNYLTFLFSAVNTLTVTYYLAIEKIPSLKIIFPIFSYYVILITSIGIPILIAIGYIHFKKSNAYKAEADIGYETHPYMKRIVDNLEQLLVLNFQLNELILKLSKNEKLTDEEIRKMTQLQNNLQDHISKKIR